MSPQELIKPLAKINIKTLGDDLLDKISDIQTRLEKWQQAGAVGAAPLSMAEANWLKLDFNLGVQLDVKRDSATLREKIKELEYQEEYRQARELWKQLKNDPSYTKEAEIQLPQIESKRLERLKKMLSNARELDLSAANLKAYRQVWQAVLEMADEDESAANQARLLLQKATELVDKLKLQAEIDTIESEFKEIQTTLFEPLKGEMSQTEKVYIYKQLDEALERLEQHHTQVIKLSNRSNLTPDLDRKLVKLRDELKLNGINPIKSVLGLGATELESGRFKEAYAHYYILFLTGYPEVTDSNGERQPIKKILDKAAEGLAKFVINKAQERMGKAKVAYEEEKDPPTAIYYIEQALAFWEDIPPPDQFNHPLLLQELDRVKRDVMDAERKYRRGLVRWEAAQAKQNEAAETYNPADAVRLLRLAQSEWFLPEREAMIASWQQQWDAMKAEQQQRLAQKDGVSPELEIVTHEVEKALSEAQNKASFDQHDYVAAQAHLTSVRQKVSDIVPGFVKLTNALERVSQFEMEIATRAKRYEIYLALIERVKSALARYELDHAESLFNRLSAEEQTTEVAIEVKRFLTAKQEETKNWREAQAAYDQADYSKACIHADAVIKHNGRFKGQAELLGARSRALELYDKNKEQWDSDSKRAAGKIKQVCEEIKRILLPTNLDDRTIPVYQKVHQRLNELK